jgi:hypothetical protein
LGFCHADCHSVFSFLVSVDLDFDMSTAVLNKMKEKTSCLMSTQCMEDLESCIIGFIELCSKLLTHENNVNIFLTPALINSDVIENEFN